MSSKSEKDYKDIFIATDLKKNFRDFKTCHFYLPVLNEMVNRLGFERIFLHRVSFFSVLEFT